MNEDYLWDKSGETDPEIERLEKTLAGMRFKRSAEPLPLPASAPPRWSFRLSNTAALAAAAGLALLILAGGVWLALRNPGSSEGKNNQVAAAPAGEIQPGVSQEQKEQRGQRVELGSGTPTVEQTGVKGPTGQDKVASSVTPTASIHRRTQQRRTINARPLLVRQRESNSLPRREQLARQGEQAKEQLIKALHIASDKLNAVQRKIQGSDAAGPIS